MKQLTRQDKLELITFYTRRLSLHCSHSESVNKTAQRAPIYNHASMLILELYRDDLIDVDVYNVLVDLLASAFTNGGYQ